MVPFLLDPEFLTPIRNQKEGPKSDSAHGCNRIHNRKKAKDMIQQPDPQGHNHYNSVLPLIFRSHSDFKLRISTTRKLIRLDGGWLSVGLHSVRQSRLYRAAGQYVTQEMEGKLSNS